jgi:hypothetical protein
MGGFGIPGPSELCGLAVLKAPDRFVEPARKLGVSVADQEPIRMISRDDFPELLASPIGRGMPRHIEVENSPSRVLDDD